MLKKTTLFALALVGVAAIASGGGALAQSKATIGIAMPTKSSARWIDDGNNIVKVLKERGYGTDLQYAEDDIHNQLSQVENMVTKGAKVLVIAAIDGTTLSDVLKQAKAKGITVIAYDRLISDTPNVDYYATFDNYKVGQLHGNFLKDQLKLDSATTPITIEPFAGSPDDNNAKYFFSGAWDVLLPYVTKGTLVVPSSKSPKSDADWASIGISAWASDKAQSEMDNRLSSFYTGKKLQAVLSPNDSLAIGIEASLKSAGYKVVTDWPMITCQDGDKANVKAILAGEQSMTVWKDTRKLGDQTFQMIQQITKGTTVDVNDTKTYNNGVKVVPSYLITPEVVTKDLVKSKLIDSGFLKASDVGL